MGHSFLNSVCSHDVYNITLLVDSCCQRNNSVFPKRPRECIECPSSLPWVCHFGELLKDGCDSQKQVLIVQNHLPETRDLITDMLYTLDDVLLVANIMHFSLTWKYSREPGLPANGKIV